MYAIVLPANWMQILLKDCQVLTNVTQSESPYAMAFMLRAIFEEEVLSTAVNDQEEAFRKVGTGLRLPKVDTIVARDVEVSKSMACLRPWQPVYFRRVGVQL